LVEIDLGTFANDLKGRKIRGQIKGNNIIPYADRAVIEAGALAGRGLEIAWAADPVEFFFLQVQGSGRLRMQDGSVVRIGYDNQNGHAYTGIGKLMKQRGLVTDGSMQGLGRYLRANPQDGKKIMQENKSFVFFREETKPGPLGAMGYQVIPETSVAADIKFVPLGAPIWLSMDRAEPNGLWIAQDTGGAIKGANRVDTFWGAGDRAVAIAGGMAARGAALLFLPKASVARLIP
jgi:membrane-bound lytic murein transglycosylase A